MKSTLLIKLATVLALFLGLLNEVRGQCGDLGGPSTVAPNVAAHFDYGPDDANYTSWSITPSGGGVVSNKSPYGGNEIGAFQHYSADVTWSAAGSQSVTFTFFGDGGGCVTTTINVTCGTLIDISNVGSLQFFSQCNMGQMLRSGSNDGLYWQTTTGGTETIGRGGSSFDITDNGYYYIRGKNSNGCWTPGYVQSQLATILKPGVPINIVGATRCGPGYVTLTASPGTSGDNVKWYSGGVEVHTGTSYSPYLTSTASYIVKTYKTYENCTGSTGMPVTGTINPLPVAPGLLATPASSCGAVSSTLTATNANSAESYRWYTTSAGSSQFTPSFNNSTHKEIFGTTKTYYVTKVVTATVCETPTRTPVTVTVGPPPVATPPATVIIATSGLPYGGGGSVNLSTSTYYSYQWYKDGALVSGATGQTYPQAITQQGTYRVDVKATSTSPTISSPNYVVGSIGAQQGVNVVSTTRIRKPGVTETTDLFTLTRSELSQTAEYNDGLGRTSQQIAIGQTPLGNDMVQAAVYDAYGRSSKNYLPFATAAVSGGFRPNALVNGTYTASEQYLFYQNALKVARDAAPYAQTVYDTSPLGRVLEQGAPGTDWQPGTNHTVKNSFMVNTAADNVRIWTEAGPKTVAPINYAAGELAVSKTTDENGNLVFQFVDKLGRLILKRVQESTTGYLDTYSVYDQRGNLVLQVPPKAVMKINTGTAWSTTWRDEWCFVYNYDQRNRLIEKKTPGAALQFYVYDPLDRLVLVQDGELRTANKWMFVKYDARQRPVMLGTYINTTHTTRAALQLNVLDALYATPGAPYYEDRGATLHGYTNLSFPTLNSAGTALEILSVNYYDDYDFDNTGTADYSYTTQGIAGEGFQASSFGLPTGSKRVIMGTTNWMTTYQFYDKYNHIIQVRSGNYLNLFDQDLTTRTYDFEGKVMKEVTTHAQKTLTWKNKVNVAIDGDKLIGTGVAGWGNSGMSSVEEIPPGQDGWLEATVTEANSQRMFGLSDVDSDQSIGAIDYAFYLAGASMLITENGVNKYTIPSGTQTGNRLRIERTGTAIKYYKDGVLVYTSLIPSSTNLMADMSFYVSGNSISQLRMSVKQGALTISKSYVYDFLGRLTRVHQTINGEPERVLASYKYNELGQQVEKNLHCKDCNDPALDQPNSSIGTTVVKTAYSASEANLLAYQSITLGPGFVTGANPMTAHIINPVATVPGTGGMFMQSVDYRYNIRGWKTNINNAKLDNDSGTTNDDADDYFGMDLLFNTVDAGLSNSAFYNGNIGAIKWKGPGETAGNKGARSYKYAYDKSDKLKDATFMAYGTAAWDKELGTLNENITHDENGNILSMLRKTVQRTLLSNFQPSATAQTMDNLAYTYATTASNKLEKVEDIGTTDGFKNGAATAIEYTYNANGSITKDDNKGINAITYTIFGKPAQMTFADGRSVTYVYDGAGNKLSMKTYTGTTLTKSTDYVGNYLYENGALSYFSSPEGRVIKNGSAYEYQYAIADHQGNTRVLFATQAPAPNTYTVSFEDNTLTTESVTFQNYPAGAWRSSVELFDHTDATTTYTRSQLLNGAAGGQVGLAKTLKVFPGDVINASVFAKYWNNTSTTSNLVGFATALTAAFGVTSGSVGDGLKAFTALNNYGGVVVANNGSGSAAAPKAFITILLFDQNFNFVNLAYDQINSSAVQVGAAPKVAHDLLAQTMTVKEPGYAYIYISNENPTLVDVYFDDMSITHTKTPVLQYNEYYPFGHQTMNSWTRENTSNNFLYNSGTELNGVTGMYDLQYRNYDPVIGRFAQIDPLANKYSSLAPYSYANNDPIFHNDPRGLEATSGGCYTCSGTPQRSQRQQQLEAFIERALNSQYGGSWESGQTSYYTSNNPAYASGVNYNIEQRNNQQDRERSIRESRKEQKEKNQDNQGGLPSQFELERRFGPSFNDYITKNFYPEFSKQFSADHSFLEKINNWFANQDWQYEIKDIDNIHYLTLAEVRIKLFSKSEGLIDKLSTPYLEYDPIVNGPRIINNERGTADGTVFNPGISGLGIIFLDSGDGYGIGLIVEFNYIFPN